METSESSNIPIDKNQEQARERIRTWLLDVGLKVRQERDERASFNFLAEFPPHRTVNVVQPTNMPGRVIIGTRGVLTPDQMTRIQRMPEGKRTEFLWNLRFALLDIGVEFSSIEALLESIELLTTVYYD